MSSSAISSQQTIARVQSALATAKVITAITAANPPVVTSAAHGYANGDPILVDGIIGMVELNGRGVFAANVTANTLELRGIDGTLYSTYVSGGTMQKATMIDIANVKGFSLFEGTTPQLPVTNLRSLRQEKIADIPDTGGGSLTLDIDVSDPGQAVLKASQQANGATSGIKLMSIVLNNGKAAIFPMFVNSFPVAGAVGQTVNTTVGFTISKPEAYFS